MIILVKIIYKQFKFLWDKLLINHLIWVKLIKIQYFLDKLKEVKQIILKQEVHQDFKHLLINQV